MATSRLDPAELNRMAIELISQPQETRHIQDFISSIGRGRRDLRTAEAERDRPVTGARKLIDPITAALTSIAFIADKTSGKRARREAAVGKVGQITGGIRERRVRRAEERRAKFAQRARGVESEQAFQEAIFRGHEAIAGVKQRGRQARAQTLTGVAKAITPKPAKELSVADKKTLAADKSWTDYKGNFTPAEWSGMSDYERINGFRRYDTDAFLEKGYDKLGLKSPDEKFREILTDVSDKIEKRYDKWFEDLGEEEANERLQSTMSRMLKARIPGISEEAIQQAVNNMLGVVAPTPYDFGAGFGGDIPSPEDLLPAVEAEPRGKPLFRRKGRGIGTELDIDALLEMLSPRGVDRLPMGIVQGQRLVP